jgi:flagellar protein FliL
MSAVIANSGADVAPIPRGKKKLIVIAAAALALVLVLGGGSVVWLKQRAAHAAAAAIDDEAAAAEHASTPRIDPKNAPIYLPLDPFVVNLADKDSDRYAQIGITLELDNGFSADQIKAYMPAIRNAVLMVLANKSSRDLMNREGKEQLAQEIMREAVRPMGIEAASPEPITAASVEVAASAALAGTEPTAKAKSAKRRDGQRNPIQHVHFSSFIIQ